MGRPAHGYLRLTGCPSGSGGVTVVGAPYTGTIVPDPANTDGRDGVLDINNVEIGITFPVLGTSVQCVFECSRSSHPPAAPTWKSAPRSLMGNVGAGQWS